MQNDEFKAQLRLPRSISQGEIIEVKVKIKHSITTGLQLVETAKTPFERFVRNQPAQFLKMVQIYYDETMISSFLLNSSMSSDPMFTFAVRADKEADLRVVVTDYKDETVETSEKIAFS